MIDASIIAALAELVRAAVAEQGLRAATPKLALNAAEFAAAIGISTRSLYRAIDAGAVPLPLHVGGGRCLVWPVSTITNWLAAGCPDREAAQRERRAV